MAIGFTINASLLKALFEVLFCENIPLPIDLLFSIKSSINYQAQKSAIKVKRLVY